MIRYVLALVGLSTGAVAQGVVPAAAVVETCGGTRVTLSAPEGTERAGLDRAAEVVGDRIGGLAGAVFDYTDVEDGQIVASLPAPAKGVAAHLPDLLRREGFGFHTVYGRQLAEAAPVAAAGRMILPAMEPAGIVYVLEETPVLTQAQIRSAAPMFDQTGRPAVSFRFTEEGAAISAAYTTENVGQPFAIVLRGEVVSAPVIMTPILGGEGMVTGAFTVAETERLAVTLSGGVMPFDVTVVREDRVDGSNPSADFCP